MEVEALKVEEGGVIKCARGKRVANMLWQVILPDGQEVVLGTKAVQLTD